MAQVTIDIDLPPGITITAYERHGNGHGFEVTWPWPERWCCPCCGLEDQARLEVTSRIRVVRDPDILGQPSFWIYQAVWHRCARCTHRHDVLPPFKRKDVAYTYRFEKQVLNLLIGSNEAEVGRRLGISAETVGRIVRNQLADDKQIDPKRIISDVGIDEISLKKRHKLYVTVLTDWTNPDHPEVLAVAPGREEAAGFACLQKLSESQRQQVRSYRADLGPAYQGACRELLPNARGVADRFHVAKLFNEAVDAERKKITRTYKAALSKAERKEFRSLMWEFRRDPDSLDAEERQRLEQLFRRLPKLKELYEIRVRFKAIFDRDWKQPWAAGQQILQLLLDAMDTFPSLESFLVTYEKWREEILNHFEARQTSAGVEGINNKARVIIKRAYGLKSADSLWTRLILDLNRAGAAVAHTIQGIRELVVGFRLLFSPLCT